MSKHATIRLRAVAHDEATGEFLAVIRFRKIDGLRGELILPRSVLRDKDELEKKLLNAGCKAADGRELKLDLGQLSEDSKHVEHWVYSARTGWRDNRHQFVRIESVIGKSRGGEIVKPPRSAQRGSWKVGVTGSRNEWSRQVAEPARQSSRLVLGICVPFAAHVSDFIELNPFGILFHGPSKAGKSTVLVGAGSVIGFAREEDLPNFRSTDAALSEMPSSFNDMLMPLNELGLLKGNRVERANRVKDLSYGIAETRGTMYSSHAKMNNPKAEERRCIVLGSGEESNDDISMGAGIGRPLGAAIRWIDLPATRRGQNDIFDFAPDKVAAADRATWAQQQCIALRNGCRANHGVASRHFVRYVIRQRRKIKAILITLIDEIKKKLKKEGDADPAIMHLLTCFAFIAAAGCLAVRAGTIPWTEKFVIKCVKRCYRDARRILRTPEDVLHDGLCLLKKQTNRRLIEVSTKHKTAKCDWDSVDGFRETKGDRTRAVIRGDTIKQWFDDQRQLHAVLRSLRARHALSCGNGSPNGTRSIKWAESQPQWPNGKRVRSIVIDLPTSSMPKSKR